MLELIKRKRQLLADQSRVARIVNLRRGSPASLSERDFRNASRTTGAPPHYLKAFHMVESAGEGFSGDRLKILYEPHIVHRRTGGVLTGRRFPWVWNGKEIEIPLSYRRWKRLTHSMLRDPDVWHPYKETVEGRWEMLATAYAYTEAALEGASYGGFQILGRRAVQIGYESPLTMIELMYKTELEHLASAIRYLKWAGGMDALRRGDWAKVERLYNGGGHGGVYAERMALAAAESERIFAKKRAYG